MSSFELNATGDGHFVLIGEMSFDTADQILKASEQIFGEYAVLEVDLSQVAKADSAGLALLLEWKSRAHQSAGEITFAGIPDSLLAIAQTTEVSDLI